MKEMKIDDVKVEKEKKAQEPAPHVKAAQIEKEAVRALSVDKVEEALTKSTYGAPEVKKADKYIDDLEDEILTVRAAYSALEGKYAKLERENKKLSDTIEELRNVRTGMAECNKDIEVLKTECLDLKEENKRYQREIDDYKKTISKMQYAHQEEVRALEDELAETKILAKKRGEAVDELDECCVTFSKIRFMANTAVDMAASLRKMAHMIEEEAEEHC